ncbi:MAG: ATP-binding protein [Proteobacteria bacterium]|nr:ATP-binding protein [Pseudomonadota bacterium]
MGKLKYGFDFPYREFTVKSAALLSVLFVALVLLPALSNAMGAKPKAVPAFEFKVVDGFSSPESVTSDGKWFYVSNVGAELKPSDKDGDGFISVLGPDGTVIERKYLTGLDAPKGMGIAGGALYVADVDRVVGFDLMTRKQVFELDFSAEGTVFLNDITVVDSTTLLVSATDIGKVYAVTLGKNKRYTPVVIDVPGVNGLEFDSINRRLFLVSFADDKGALSVIPFAHGPGDLQDLTGPVGRLDGVALLPGGKVLFSDWVKFGSPGKLHLFDIETGKFSDVELKEASIGPADFFYDSSANRIWLPRMVEGKVMIQELK